MGSGSQGWLLVYDKENCAGKKLGYVFLSTLTLAVKFGMNYLFVYAIQLNHSNYVN